ncbi:MAG TPA: amidohydrolase family protein [Acetobacteraceae bacterium]|nr:amidohydrolase family protein [Acetobacteraceae bacterium]
MPTILRADRLIDGTGATPIDDPYLITDGGKIAAVHAGGIPEGAVPPGTQTMSFPGCTILPGLIDTHVHLNLPGDGSLLETIMRETDGVLLAIAAHTARTALDAGITTVRDVGAARDTVFDLRRALQLGHGTAAKIVAGGQPITITGGHTWPWGGEADGEDGCRCIVRNMCKRGADFIKVMATGGGTVGTLSWLPSFRPEELKALADEAHRNGRMATAHALCARAIEDVIDAGFDQIEHASFITGPNAPQKYEPAVGEKIARAGIPVTGTLAVGGAILRELGGKSDPTPDEQFTVTRWRRMYDENLAQFQQLYAAGVTFVAGTDAGWRFTRFDDLGLEMQLMHAGGMPVMETIVAATGRAADVIRIADRTGRLKPGLAADVLVVAGNPLDDLKRLNDVRFVMQDGKVRVQHNG